MLTSKVQTPTLKIFNKFQYQLCKFASQPPLPSLTDGSDDTPMFYNRNPRNLERLRIAYKVEGYHLEKPGRNFWHKMILERSKKHVTASVIHNTGVRVITASSREWAIRKFLYSTNDTSAYRNIGRVIAQRCLESGLYEMRCDLTEEEGGKVGAFVAALKDSGLILKELERYYIQGPWYWDRPEKPWEIFE